MTEEQISDMIENADGMRCIDGEYRIEGRNLMNLVAAILQAATHDDFEARFIAKHGHRLASLLGINAFDLADRDAQIMAVLAANRDAMDNRPLFSTRQNAARYQWLKAWNKLDGWTDEMIDRQIAIDAQVVAASATKEST